MKKLTALLLCMMMLLGSLCVFAEDGITPLVDCDHQYGTHDVCVQSGVKVSTCKYKDVYKVYCDECGRVVGSYNNVYTSHEGPVKEVNGVDICQACGKKA